jgi:hypothetical protein
MKIIGEIPAGVSLNPVQTTYLFIIPKRNPKSASDIDNKKFGVPANGIKSETSDIWHIISSRRSKNKFARGADQVIVPKWYICIGVVVKNKNIGIAKNKIIFENLILPIISGSMRTVKVATNEY